MLERAKHRLVRSIYTITRNAADDLGFGEAELFREEGEEPVVFRFETKRKGATSACRTAKRLQNCGNLYVLQSPTPRAARRRARACTTYRTRCHGRARKALTRVTDAMAHSSLPEVQTLRTTLMRWRREVLVYFLCRLSNARTEAAPDQLFTQRPPSSEQEPSTPLYRFYFVEPRGSNPDLRIANARR